MSVSGSGQGRVAVITGGGSGIGLAVARIFAASGYSVVITGRGAKRLQDAAAKISDNKQQVTGISCDVRDPVSVEKLFHEIGKRHSTIDVLINNAGVAHALAPVDQLPVETWKDVIDTNLTGTFLVTRAALPLMRAGGTIINNASKFGALGFTHALREDLRKRGIRVVALLPGATDTDIWNQFWSGAPKEKMISAETVAQAVLHVVLLPANSTIEEIRIGPAAGVL
jgi:NAD(P)-dependent dehydrogenase (short-subunit alcohol dehydrogenase family)